jgi:hypothetical protein
MGSAMKNMLLPVAVALGFSCGVALAADPPAGTNPRSACQPDVQKLCAGVPRGGGRIVACLQQNQAQVSAACKEALAKARPKEAPPAPGAPPG